MQAQCRPAPGVFMLRTVMGMVGQVVRWHKAQERPGSCATASCSGWEGSSGKWEAGSNGGKGNLLSAECGGNSDASTPGRGQMGKGMASAEQLIQAPPCSLQVLYKVP